MGTSTSVCSVATQTAEAIDICDEANDSAALLYELIALIVENIVDKVELNIKRNMVPSQKSRKKALQSGVVGKRRSYDQHERAAIVKSIDKNQSLKKTVASVREVRGYENFNMSTLRRMRKMKVMQKRGRKVNREFEEAVLDYLVYAVVEKDHSRERLQVCERMLR